MRSAAPLTTLLLRQVVPVLAHLCSQPYFYSLYAVMSNFVQDAVGPEGQHKFMKSFSKLPSIPASLFGMVLGLAGLGNAWRIAHRIWSLPGWIGETIFGLAALIWMILVTLFSGKWMASYEKGSTEFRHPVQSTYVSLIGIATNLLAIGLLPYSRRGAVWTFAAASLLSIGYGIFLSGKFWSEDRRPNSITASLYLPTVAGCFVTGTAAAALGFSGLAQLAFGAGMFSWLSIESIVLHRLYTGDQIPCEQRPSLGIQFAPAAVASVAYLSIRGGVPDIFGRALFGYALLQAFVLMRMFRWITAQPISVSYWSFTFGAASMATSACRMVEHGETGAIMTLAPIVFSAANLLIAVVAIITVRDFSRQVLARSIV
jgi:tellurite resistance protein